MKALFDTSVLVAAMVESHPAHQAARPWLEQALAGKMDLFVSHHTLAELYAVLTGLPIKPRITPGTARRLIHENVEQKAEIVGLTPSDYSAVIKEAAENGLTGGSIYDALIAKAAAKAGVKKLLTLNLQDFKRVWPAGGAVICAP